MRSVVVVSVVSVFDLMLFFFSDVVSVVVGNLIYIDSSEVGVVFGSFEFP